MQSRPISLTVPSTGKGVTLAGLTLITLGFLLPKYLEALSIQEVLVSGRVLLSVGLFLLAVQAFHVRVLVDNLRFFALFLILAVFGSVSGFTKSPDANTMNFAIFTTLFFLAALHLARHFSLLVKFLAIAPALNLPFLLLVMWFSKEGFWITAWGRYHVFSGQQLATLGALGVLSVFEGMRAGQWKGSYRLFLYLSGLVTMSIGFSATPILALAVALPLWKLTTTGKGSSKGIAKRKDVPIVFAFGMLCIAAVGIAVAFFQSLGPVATALGRSSTGSGRFPIWEVALNKLLHSPWFGYGFGGDTVEFNGTTTSHNLFLGRALTYGLVIAAILLTVALIALFRGIGETPSPSPFILFALIAGMSAGDISNFFLTNFLLTISTLSVFVGGNLHYPFSMQRSV